MKEIEVLGSGCAKCVKTAELIQMVADDCGIQVQVVKESRPEVIMKYGVMSTPAVVIDKQLIHSGSVPDRKRVEEWLQYFTIISNKGHLSPPVASINTRAGWYSGMRLIA
jgi:predicted thioredoxin/glutaredoxin